MTNNEIRQFLLREMPNGKMFYNLEANKETKGHEDKYTKEQIEIAMAIYSNAYNDYEQNYKAIDYNCLTTTNIKDNLKGNSIFTISLPINKMPHILGLPDAKQYKKCSMIQNFGDDFPKYKYHMGDKVIEHFGDMIKFDSIGIINHATTNHLHLNWHKIALKAASFKALELYSDGLYIKKTNDNISIYQSSTSFKNIMVAGMPNSSVVLENIKYNSATARYNPQYLEVKNNIITNKHLNCDGVYYPFIACRGQFDLDYKHFVDADSKSILSIAENMRDRETAVVSNTDVASLLISNAQNIDDKPLEKDNAILNFALSNNYSYFNKKQLNDLVKYISLSCLDYDSKDKLVSKTQQYLNKVTKNDALSNQSCNENNYHIAKTLKK
jgi:hypothetical protein